MHLGEYMSPMSSDLKNRLGGEEPEQKQACHAPEGGPLPSAHPGPQSGVALAAF